MKDNFTQFPLRKVFNISRIYTFFYMELPKNFSYSGERHDFWEMVYIDKGEMLCTAGDNRFTLKSGELAFHKPNEFHNLSGNNTEGANICILTFGCDSKAMSYFENTIFRLTAEDKSLLSALISEGLACFALNDPNDPLLPNNMHLISPQPFGGSQMVKNFFEIFLIRLSRKKDTVPTALRQNVVIDGQDVPYAVKEILDYLKANLYSRITVADVAKAVGKGESTVKKIFSLYRKKGIMRYYNELKIKEARHLIRDGRYNLTQISDMLCFDSPQYFSKCFKDVCKMTPTQYRRSVVK